MRDTSLRTARRVSRHLLRGLRVAALLDNTPQGCPA